MGHADTLLLFLVAWRRMHKFHLFVTLGAFETIAFFITLGAFETVVLLSLLTPAMP